MAAAPHVIPYQGSKRKLASRICRFFPHAVDTLYEPFAGSAAVSIYAAQHHLAKRFVVGDVFAPLVELHRMIVQEPEAAAKAYAAIWSEQGDTPQKRYDFFFLRFALATTRSATPSCCCF